MISSVHLDTIPHHGSHQSTVSSQSAAEQPLEPQIQMQLQQLQLRVVLLDVDGTLVDSVNAHTGAWFDACQEHGHSTKTFEEIAHLVGMGGDKILPIVAGGMQKDSPEGERFTKRRMEIFNQRYLPTIKPFPHAKELLERLKQSGMRLIVVTSAKDDEMQSILQQTGLDSILTERTSSSDASRSKPDPDIVQAALKRCADVPVKQIVFVGDTAYDIEAAAKCGVETVAVRSGGWTTKELSGAVEVWDNVGQLFERFDESVLSGIPTAAK
eukprot:TRINITY_DN11851_c0_g1_i1.p1 TRINITY_DN11851_c0_g1~~TRINITY_DN11851_c0_g1_i1.p1  ORF type:complete len:269 (-),score=60.16 TRINITY_DN11851_c0_g1_i1:141-947(-)